MAKVLIADDTSMIRAALRLFLDGTDHEVVGEAEDGLTAVDQANRLHPDVVILDIQMPNLDGIEAAKRILKQRPQTYVIISSLHAETEYVQRARRAGVHAFLVKPVPQERLLQEIEKAGGRNSTTYEGAKNWDDDVLREF